MLRQQYIESIKHELYAIKFPNNISYKLNANFEKKKKI